MLDIQHLNKEYETKSPGEIITWAVETFGADIAMSSSFQMQSLPLLHIVSTVAPQLPIIFLDTGYHFPETLAFRDHLVDQWNLNLRIVRATSSQENVGQHDDGLYRRNPDLCCYINKVEPMQRVMAELQAWISGIRRDQLPTRANTQIIEQTPQGTIRVHPMASWTRQHIWQYIHDHNLPEHPLFGQGYLSIGCAPCTRPIFEGQDTRAGRWIDQEKTECGLHTLLRNTTADHQLVDTDLRNDPK